MWGTESATSDWEETSSMGGAKREDLEELKLEAESMDDELPVGGIDMVFPPALCQTQMCGNEATNIVSRRNDEHTGLLSEQESRGLDQELSLLTCRCPSPWHTHGLPAQRMLCHTCHSQTLEMPRLSPNLISSITMRQQCQYQSQANLALRKDQASKQVLGQPSLICPFGHHPVV